MSDNQYLPSQNILPETNEVQSLGETGRRFLNVVAKTVTADTITGIVIGGVTFDQVQTGINTTATMTVGTGASIGVSGSGTIDVTSLLGKTWAVPAAIGTTTPASGAFTTLTASTSTTTPLVQVAASDTAATLTAANASGVTAWAETFASITQTSGTNTLHKITGSFAPTATSTMASVGLYLNPTINYSNGTPGAGTYNALQIDVVETANPSGTKNLILARAGAAGTTAKFTVDNSGGLSLAGSIGVDGQTAPSIGVAAIQIPNGARIKSPAGGFVNIYDVGSANSTGQGLVTVGSTQATSPTSGGLTGFGFVDTNTAFTPPSGTASWIAAHIVSIVNGTSSGTAYGLLVAGKTNTLTGGTVKLASFGTTTTDGFTGYTEQVGIQTNGGITHAGVTFANLGTPANGTVQFCTDCDPPTLIDSTCTHAGAQTGSLAFRVNGAWKCIS